MISLNTDASSTHFITLVLHTVMECTLEVKIASRGYHVYGKSIWSNPEKEECLIGEQETDPVALLEDPYAIAWKLQKKDKLVPVVVAHIAREILRLVWYFIKYGRKVSSQVHSERPRLSPIPSGGLELLLMAKLTISDEKRQYLAHLKTFIEKNYQVAEKEEDDLHEQEEDICDDNEDDTIILENDEHDI